MRHQADGRTHPGSPAAGEPAAGTAGRRGWSVSLPRVAGAGPFTIRFRAVPPALQGLLALVIYLAVWVPAWALPLVTHPGWPLLDQSSMDPNFYVWGLRWWPYALAHGLNPFTTTQIGAPAGFNLAWVTTAAPVALLFSPLTAAVGPLAAFNLLVAVSLPVSAWAAFVLCRRLTGRFWPALAGGALYGFSAYMVNHNTAGQLNMTFSLLLPLMAYLVLLWRDGKLSSPAFVVLLALLMVVQFYLFLETFAAMTAVWVVALALGYALAGRGGRPAVARLSGLVGLAYLLAIVFTAPYIVYALAHMPPGFLRSPVRWELDLASLVVPRPTQTFGLAWLANYAARLPNVSREGYVGIPLLLIAVALAITTWSRKITRLLSLLLIFLIVVSLGPALKVGGHQITSLPWSRLWYLPIVRSAFPARFMLFAFLVLAVMAALWLAGPAKRPWAWARWLLALLAVAAVVTNTPALHVPSQNELPPFIATGQYRHYLSPGDTVVVVSLHGNAGLLWQAETGFYTRLAGGYVNMVITPRTDRPPAVAALAHATPGAIRRFRSFVRTAKIAAILVDANAQPKWTGIFKRLGLRGKTVGGVIIYRTAHWPAPGHHQPSQRR